MLVEAWYRSSNEQAKACRSSVYARITRHRLPVVEMLAISLRLPIRWPATR